MLKSIQWGPKWPGLNLKDDAQVHTAAQRNEQTKQSASVLEGQEGFSESAVPGAPITGLFVHQADDGSVSQYCVAGASIWRWSGSAWVVQKTPAGDVAVIGPGEIRAIQIGKQTFVSKVED